jgi:hypothetical protein
MLPDAVSDAIINPSGSDDPLGDELLCALRVMYNWTDDSEIRFSLYRSPPPFVYTARFFARYQRLLQWVTSEERHLRLMMAQFQQLSCRFFGMGTHFNVRCSESLADLVRMGSGDVENLRYWA